MTPTPDLSKLPDDPLALSLAELRAVVERRGELAGVLACCTRRRAALLDAMEPRVTHPHQTVAELATEQEAAELVWLERRYDAADFEWRRLGRDIDPAMARLAAK